MIKELIHLNNLNHPAMLIKHQFHQVKYFINKGVATLESLIRPSAALLYGSNLNQHSSISNVALT